MGISCSKQPVAHVPVAEPPSLPSSPSVPEPDFFEPLPSPNRRKRRSVEVEIPPESPDLAHVVAYVPAPIVQKRPKKTCDSICWWFTVVYGTYVLWSLFQTA
jgi:hypothetical protein